MLSKSQIKFITSLHQKKYRDQHGLFFAEGYKTISEFLDSNIQLHELYVTKAFNISAKQVEISEKDLKKLSVLKTPNSAFAIFKIPKPKPIDFSALILALDNVRDPGNMGTIIRLCDWFGIKDLVCSNKTVDCYNPKVVQASMGSLSRVNITYLDLVAFLKEKDVTSLGAFMDGENVYKTMLPKQGVLVMGNEANGISSTIEVLLNKRITIPRFGELQETESLNVAMATAILLSEFKKRTIEM